MSQNVQLIICGLIVCLIVGALMAAVAIDVLVVQRMARKVSHYRFRSIKLDQENEQLRAEVHELRAQRLRAGAPHASLPLPIAEALVDPHNGSRRAPQFEVVSPVS